MDSRLPMTFGEIEDPVTMEERHQMAQFTTDTLGLTMPALVDTLEDEVSHAYFGWPERLYLVGPKGDILFRCGRGPFGFDPDGLEAAIEAHVQGQQGPR